ncbi:hypothetical protein AB1K91_09670 [Terribacillus sp. 179-K 1B1 HS]|uniref:hypothetical protein n=1 Tax=Terribacillus sp. 179-K 1B1 HS TaxID=3142388 RepID=UPI0039A32B3C
MPFEPILIQDGPVKQDFTSYRVLQSEVRESAIKLQNDKQASYLGVDYDLNEVSNINAFCKKHEFYSESDSSPWRSLLIFKNRTQNRVNELKGCMYTSFGDAGVERYEITTKEQWLNLIHDIFYEHFIAYAEEEVDYMWSKVQKEHFNWMRNIN